jgi:hypothetical protein
MSTTLLASLRRAALAGSTVWLASCAVPTPNADGALARATQTMGSDRVTTLRYVAEGGGYTFGQAYRPGGAWPRITLHSVTRSIDYASGSMRDEVVLSRAEPLGGGGYPLSGQQRTEQYVSGDLAWNQAGTTATPGAALRRRPHAPALDHAARRAEGGAAKRRSRRGRCDGREHADLHRAGAATARRRRSMPTVW